jgi:hypothetical protein
MGIVLSVGCLLVPYWALAEVPGATVPRDPRLPIALVEARRENWKCLMRGNLSQHWAIPALPATSYTESTEQTAAYSACPKAEGGNWLEGIKKPE